MRVLHVYSGNLYGGVETFLVALARHRSLRPSMEPHFALVFEGLLSKQLRQTGVPVHTFGGVRISRPGSVLRARAAFARLLSAEPFDCVICHSAWPHLIVAPVVRAAGKSLGFWLHDIASGWHWTEWWARRTPPDFAICCSRFAQTTLPRIFGSVSLVSHYYYALAAGAHPWTEAERASARSGLDCPESGVVIVQQSRMAEYKGHRLHLEALGLLRDVPGWVCWMIGAPQGLRQSRYYRDLQDYARRLGIADRIRFTGWVHHDKVQLLMAAAQIHCQPNTGPEPFGIAFVEAMSAGVPVVTTALGGAMEVVDESCGLLTPPGDSKALAANLRRLIADAGLRKKLGDGGIARAKELCDPEKNLGKLEELIARGTGI